MANEESGINLGAGVGLLFGGGVDQMAARGRQGGAGQRDGPIGELLDFEVRYRAFDGTSLVCPGRGGCNVSTGWTCQTCGELTYDDSGDPTR